MGCGRGGHGASVPVPPSCPSAVNSSPCGKRSASYQRKQPAGWEIGLLSRAGNICAYFPSRKAAFDVTLM